MSDAAQSGPDDEQRAADPSVVEAFRAELERYDRAGGQMLLVAASELARAALQPLVEASDPVQAIASDSRTLNRLKAAAGAFVHALAALAPSATEDVRAEQLRAASTALPIATLYARLTGAWETGDHAGHTARAGAAWKAAARGGPDNAPAERAGAAACRRA